MTFGLAVVLAVLVLAVILFVTERLPVDLVALSVLALLLVTGIVTTNEGFAGFSNSATVTVAAMFVLSAGLARTGVLDHVGLALARLSVRSYGLGLVAMMVLVGAVSAFINNTAAVAVFLPIVLSVARESKTSPSKLLMPLSFASMFGGVCTLLGTSTNILVNTIAVQHGLRPFGIFEFSSLGLVFFGTGLLYMVVAGARLVPARREPAGLTQTYLMSQYLTEVTLLPDSPSVGTPMHQAPLVHELDLDVIQIRRGGRSILMPLPDAVLQAGDVLRVRCDVGKIQRLQQQEGVALKPKTAWHDEDLETAEALLVESVVAPNSILDGRTLKDVGFRNTFGATVLAVRHRDRMLHERLARTRLVAGDVLLLEVPRGRLEQLRQHGAFVIVSEVPLPTVRPNRVAAAVAILAAVVATATLGLAPIAATATAGCVLMILTGCLTLEEAYRAIEWKVIFLLAGVLTLGVALEKTGGAELIARGIVGTVGGWGPVAMVSAFYLVTSLLTETMSNNATAALVAPIALVTAEATGVDPRPFLMAVTFAASASFLTPVGYQTNTLIYGPGQYRFRDFFRVGLPLNLMFWLLATWLIPRIWPL